MNRVFLEATIKASLLELSDAVRERYAAEMELRKENSTSAAQEVYEDARKRHLECFDGVASSLVGLVEGTIKIGGGE